MFCFSTSSPGPKNGVLDALNTKCFWSVIQSDIKLLSVFPTSVLGVGWGHVQRELSRTLQTAPSDFCLITTQDSQSCPYPVTLAG